MNFKRVFIIGYILIMLQVYLIGVFKEPQWVSTFSISLTAILLEAIPFMLLGSLIGGLLEVFLNPEILVKYTKGRRGFISIFIAAILGCIFPICECAIVPVVRRLLKKGLPIGAAISYLLAGPSFNPLVFLSTYLAYGLSIEIALLRIFLSLFIAVSVGILAFLFLKDRMVFTQEHLRSGDESHSDCSTCCDHEHHHHHQHENQQITSHWTKHYLVLQHARDEFISIFPYLIVGASCSAFFQSSVSQNHLLGLVSEPLLSIFFMMILAILLNICSESDAFIAATFKTSGIPLSAQMAFMLIGPIVDLKLIAMYLPIFKKRYIAIFVSILFVMVFSISAFLSLSSWGIR